MTETTNASTHEKSRRHHSRCDEGASGSVSRRTERRRAGADARACPPAREPDQRLQRLHRLRRQGRQEADETDERLFAVSAWREAPYFTDAERAALALSEAMTRLSDSSDPVPDKVWNEAARHYDEKALASLVLWIATTNLYNRVNVTTRQPAGASWS
jgi:hypothetical protein